MIKKKEKRGKKKEGERKKKRKGREAKRKKEETFKFYCSGINRTVQDGPKARFINAK